jgi:hypothetical protein
MLPKKLGMAPVALTLLIANKVRVVSFCKAPGIVHPPVDTFNGLLSNQISRMLDNPSKKSPGMVENWLSSKKAYWRLAKPESVGIAPWKLL